MKFSTITVVLASLTSIAIAAMEMRPGFVSPNISGMGISGDVVILTVNLPPGFTNVVLQTTPLLDRAWNDAQSKPVPLTGGTIEFETPRGETLFMRVVAFGTAGKEESGQVNYNTFPSNLPTSITEDQRISHNRESPLATFHFKGAVDGLDTIRFSPAGILWTHLVYQTPQRVWLNGRSWNPGEINLIDLGATLAGKNIAWERTKLEVLTARDIVALEKQKDFAVIHFYDTPWGAGEYEFKVQLFEQTTKPAAKGKSARLHISATIDGSDQLVVNSKGAQWEHMHWRWPTEVQINGKPWDPAKGMLEGGLVPAGIDFRTARVHARSGRGFINLEPRENDVLVSFADDAPGADRHELEIVFGE